MTPRESLDHLRRVEQAATKGPWHAPSVATGVRHLERNCEWYGEECPDDFYLPGRQGGDGGQRDGEFIALARNTFAALLDVAEAYDILHPGSAALAKLAEAVEAGK